MKKAVVVGGSNGIGLSIVKELAQSGYFVYVLDLVKPNLKDFCKKENTEYVYTDLTNINPNTFLKLSEDDEINFLMITAGFGRVAPFSSVSIQEIRDIFRVNTVAGLEIIKYFYNRIQSNSSFYTGMMVSIAGMISSPLFATYAASKSALNRFIESINIELESEGYANRILNVSPGSIKGTKFNGGENDYSLTSELAGEIVSQVLSKNEIFIPEYDAIYSDVLRRYQLDSHQFGLDSYEYKLKSNRVSNEKKKAISIGYLSGTFDLFHVGHLNLLKNAKKHCDYLIVGVHPDASHKGKKTFIPFEERKQIVASNMYVDEVVTSTPEDSAAWDLYHYNYLFVGSDYKGTERFNKYEEYFSDKDVEIIYFPYTQGTSSTQIRKTVSQRIENES
ncbi:Glycerol-3-phosphate cytidylyltransferase [Streptococcus thermophilus]|uniref:SDR family NAD(P)-dependent oxidoreductase n=1 Tax=Streptococcus thermophilus TaxID=1308 RepID=UPI0015C227F4|nr:SDR family NAD(P)-dependent oxidoreductase [Streptococcus thermophilus]MCE2282225.1 SDR family NAD(P)-dependent oxidoreductase [Streptococcus thermophilus]MCE2285265.1 SDR family NAD(P)-dependent oxidoreductase [Streptococcus thermophilus]CAD0147618.1 Glycerol-3-phosphate cytidylyltransferase [Streptococcus thermophilus]CAD0150114.1 Glycerol-3-phosphate cytidylyltransferase [Streptococcus thermophilus]